MRKMSLNWSPLESMNGYSFRRLFLPDKALAAAGVYSENVLEQPAPRKYEWLFV